MTASLPVFSPHRVYAYPGTSLFTATEGININAWVFYFEPVTNVPITLMFNSHSAGGTGGQQTDYATISGSTRVYQIRDNSIGDAVPISG